MGYIIHKMGSQRPKGFFGFNIFLPTNLTKASLHFSITIQTIFFYPFLLM